MIGLGIFSPTRIASGFIITAFVITPTITDPQIFVAELTTWIGKITPVITQLVGRILS